MKNGRFAWDRTSQKERSQLLQQWETEDAYPYGQSNAKQITTKIVAYYLRKRVGQYNADHQEERF